MEMLQRFIGAMSSIGRRAICFSILISACLLMPTLCRAQSWSAGDWTVWKYNIQSKTGSGGYGDSVGTTGSVSASANDGSSTATIDITFRQIWTWSGGGIPTTLTLVPNCTESGSSDFSTRVDSTANETSGEGTGWLVTLTNAPNCVNYDQTTNGSSFNAPIVNKTSTVYLEAEADVKTSTCSHLDSLRLPFIPHGASHLVLAVFGRRAGVASANTTVWFTKQ
ncbi:MAG TPA: hypothetical protein VKU00_27545 [Chthonomonadaceae bacterium]|nr:hypothetical protein [Chthonomonadaceae bacterium]